MAGAPVLIVGAGPAGMTLELELARFETPAILLDRKPGLEPEGSRAIVITRQQTLAETASSAQGCTRLHCGDS